MIKKLSHSSASGTPKRNLARPNKQFDIQLPFRGKIAYLAPQDIRRNPKAARTHSRKQIRQLAAVIDKLGFINPIIIDEHHKVLAGHGRLSAAILLDLHEVPTVQVDHLTEDEKRAYVLADNRIAENAGWDREALAIELGDLAFVLPDMGLHIEDLGFPTGQLDSLLADHTDEDAKDPADQFNVGVGAGIVSLRGDLWQLGADKHRVLCGDTQSPADIASLCDNASVGLVLTDPPYNVRVQGHVGGRGNIKHKEFAFASGEIDSIVHALDYLPPDPGVIMLFSMGPKGFRRLK